VSQIKGRNSEVAVVETDGRLNTLSTTIPVAGYYCETGATYRVTTLDDPGEITVPSTSGYMLYIKNTGSTSDLKVQRICVSANNAAVITRLHLDLSTGTLANTVDNQVFSMRSGFGGTPTSITASVWNGSTSGGITGLSGGTIMDCWAYGAGTWHTDYDDRLILPSGANLAISAYDGAGSYKVQISVEFVEVAV